MNVYITADHAGISTGGGVVTKREYEVFSSRGESLLLDRSKISPSFFGEPDTTSGFDYIADAMVLQLMSSGVKHAHFYAGMFSKTVDRLKRAGSTVTYTVAAHDPIVSREEFESLGLKYDFPYVTNQMLWASYIEGQLQSDLVICPSHASANLVRRFGCLRVTVIPHGVNLPESIPALPNEFNVGYLGQAGPDKGLRYLFSAWKLLQLPSSKLIMAGRDSSLMHEFYLRFGGGLVELKGFVEKTSDLYKAISCYVQPSATEGFGIEVLEAMAHGRPAIVSDGAGVADVITDGVDGFVVPKRDVNAIADRILTLKNDPVKLQEMSLKAIETAQKYTWPKIQAMYTEAWNGIK